MEIKGLENNQPMMNGVYQKEEEEEKQESLIRPPAPPENNIGPAYIVEQSETESGPKVYSVEKDSEGNLQFLLDGKDQTQSQLFDKALDALHDAPAGKYTAAMDQDGNMVIEPMEAKEGDSIQADEAEETDELEEKPVHGEKAGRKEEDESDGWSWCIVEMEPDPLDPDNPQKAKKRIVAQGKGRTPGINAK